MKRARKGGSKIILVLGGAASGKSQFALGLAGQVRPRAFVATGEALDSEMAARITRHQASRSEDWHTAEVPVDVDEWFTGHGHTYQSVVLDCLTLWLSNIRRSRVTEAAIHGRVSRLLEAMRKSSAQVVIVSNELGLGLVPVGPAVRKFRDLAGKVNQQVAAEADEVHFVISGQPLRLK
jgi:adenosylcobinamide kinase/adenosylcobinamide-phosphate guanylyltransferase